MTALLVTGNEEYLRALAVRDFLTTPRASEPDLVVTLVEGAEVNAHDIHEHLGPSLFGGFPTLHITDAHKLSKDGLVAALGYANDPTCALILEVAKPAEAGGKALVTAATKAGATVVDVALSSKPWEKTKQVEQFTTKELARLGVRAAPGAVPALVDGEADLRGIATRISQLRDDHTTTDDTPAPTITVEHVLTVATTAAVTGFVVSDALVARNPNALATAVRDALAAGAAPLFIQAACLSAIRNLAAIRTGKTPRLPPAKARDMQRAASQWTNDRLATALHELGVVGDTVRSSVKTQNDLMAALLRAIA